MPQQRRAAQCSRGLFRRLAHGSMPIVDRQAERTAGWLVVLGERRFVAAVDSWAWGAGSELDLYGAAGGEILCGDYLDRQRQVCVPVALLILGLDVLGDIERRLHGRSVRSPIHWKHAE